MKSWLKHVEHPKTQHSTPGRDKIGPAYYMWVYLQRLKNEKPKKDGNDVQFSSKQGGSDQPAPSKPGNSGTGPAPSAPNCGPFPCSWGKPPSMPFKLVKLPKPYSGLGSPSLAKWIKEKSRK